MSDKKQLDEISRGTLASYVKKSAVSLYQNREKGKDHQRWGEEDFVKGKSMDIVRAHRDKASDHFDKAERRRKGIDRATERLAKEEVELEEGKMKELAHDINNLDNGNFKKKYGKSKDFYSDFKTQKDTSKQNIQEVSRNLATRYIKKSVKWRDFHDNEADYHADKLSDSVLKGDLRGADEHATELRYNIKKFDRRNKGLDKAMKRLAKEEVEQIDELSKSTLRSYAGKAAFQVAVNPSNPKEPKRRAGITLAGKKLDVMADKSKAKVMAKEEVEQIDEISNKTVSKYLNKAVDSGVRAMSNRDKLPAGTQRSEIDKYNKTIDKRVAGLKNAKKRLKMNEEKTTFNVSNGSTTVNMGDDFKHVGTHKGHKIYQSSDDESHHIVVRPDNTVHSMFSGTTQQVKQALKSHGLDNLAVHKEEAKPLRSILEGLKRRGRPKKKRDMFGNTIDDDETQS